MSTEAHFHHMARRHHATMKKLDGLRARFTGFAQRGVSTLETGAGALLGGFMDGKLQWNVSPSVMLGVGTVLLNFLDFGGERDSVHYGNVGMGFLAAPLARAGFRFGQRLRGAS